MGPTSWACGLADRNNGRLSQDLSGLAVGLIRRTRIVAAVTIDEELGVGRISRHNDVHKIAAGGQSVEPEIPSRAGTYLLDGNEHAKLSLKRRFQSLHLGIHQWLTIALGNPS